MTFMLAVFIRYQRTNVQAHTSRRQTNTLIKPSSIEKVGLDKIEF